MVKAMKERNISIANEDIFLVEPNAHSFDFYSGYNHTLVSPGEIDKKYHLLSKKYLLVNRGDRDLLLQRGYKIDTVISQPDYNVAKVSLKFLNPSSREKRLDTLMLVQLYRE